MSGNLFRLHVTDRFCPTCREIIRPRNIWHRLKEKLLGSRPQADYGVCLNPNCRQDLNVHVPIDIGSMGLANVAFFESFIVLPPNERAVLLGFPGPAGYGLSGLKGEERTEWLHWLESKLPESDFERFQGLIDSLVFYLYHSAYTHKLSSRHAALQQKLWDIGMHKIEDVQENIRLMKSETMAEIYKEYLIEVNYIPYPPNYELTAQFENGTLGR